MSTEFRTLLGELFGGAFKALHFLFLRLPEGQQKEFMEAAGVGVALPPFDMMRSEMGLGLR